MRRTSDETRAALEAADPGLAELYRLYARHAPADVVDPDDAAGVAAALVDAARAHRTLAARRAPGGPLIDLRGPVAEGAITVVDIITDDMPFLVESVLTGLGRIGARVRRVVHPVVELHRRVTGELVEVLPSAAPGTPPPGALAEVWMRLELDPFPADEAEDLVSEVRQVLDEVREVVEDRDRMAATAKGLAAQLAARSPATEVQDAAHLLEWLAAGHFTFLGYRRYELDRTGGGQSQLRGVLASGLGVLRRDDLTSAPFAPAAGPDGAARQPLVLTRASTPNRVFRPVHPSQLGVRIVDTGGRVTGEHRFLGVLTVAALHESVLDIPAVERRVRAAVHRAGFPLESYAGQQMLEIIAEYPREELFWADEQSLHDTATGVLTLTEPRRLRLFLRREPYRRFFSCLVYLPRDRYSTRARLAMQKVLLRELNGWRIDHTVRVGESRLALVHFTVQADPLAPEPDEARLQGQLGAAILTWDDWVLDMAGAGDDEIADYVAGVPEGYKDDVDPVRAVADLRRIRGLEGPEMELSVETGGDAGAGTGELRFRLFLVGAGVTLSAVLPVLQSLGVDVLDERPYAIVRPDGSRCWLYDFGLRLDEAARRALAGRRPQEVERAFCAAFRAAWRGDAEVDRFNALVLRAGLGWREAALLRAYARYASQLGGPFGPEYVAETLVAHPAVTRGLIELFRARFDPALSAEERERAHADALGVVTGLIDEVAGLDADRILRGFLGMVSATVRTNWFRERPFVVFKIDPVGVAEMPLPRPWREVFVYSPRVEGVHLRFGPVARGG
ncbi:NAD-glutamate dehydrogenase domain-containing protein, partial [Pseudonocardia acidicola]